MISAKTTSHIAMIFSACWVAILTIIKGLGFISLDIWDIIYSGGAVVLVFAPTSVSVWLDKLADIRHGRKPSA